MEIKLIAFSSVNHSHNGFIIFIIINNSFREKKIGKSSGNSNIFFFNCLAHMTSQKKRNTSPKKLEGSESLGVSVCLNIAEAL